MPIFVCTMSPQPELDASDAQLPAFPGGGPLVISGHAQPVVCKGVPTIAKAGGVKLLGAPRPGQEILLDAPRDLMFAGEVLSIRYLSNGEPRLGLFRCSSVERMIGLRDRVRVLLLGEPAGTQQRGAFRARIDFEVDAMVAAGARRFRVMVRDASITGIGIETGQQLAMGDVLALHVPVGDAVAYEVVRSDSQGRGTYGLRACDPAAASGFFATLVKLARDRQQRGVHDERRAREKAERQRAAVESKKDAVEAADKRMRKSSLPPGMYTRPEPEPEKLRPPQPPSSDTLRPQPRNAA
jgi:hypothetical protein